MANAAPILSDELLRTFHERAPVYDRENRFFTEDFEDLREDRLPQDGGAARVRRPRHDAGRVHARDAPPRLLGAGHGARASTCTCTGAASRRRCRPAGTPPATGCSRPPARARSSRPATRRPGHDLPVLLSTTKAEQVDGGYRFTGRKAFGSLSPVWTLLGLHGMDTSDPKAPKIVHGFLDARREGLPDRADLGRARHAGHHRATTRSSRAPSCRTPGSRGSSPPGAAGVDLFVLSIFAWALLGFANVYYALGAGASRPDARVARRTARRSPSRPRWRTTRAMQ